MNLKQWSIYSIGIFILTCTFSFITALFIKGSFEIDRGLIFSISIALILSIVFGYIISHYDFKNDNIDEYERGYIKGLEDAMRRVKNEN
jgi:hypothetical protein